MPELGPQVPLRASGEFARHRAAALLAGGRARVVRSEGDVLQRWGSWLPPAGLGGAVEEMGRGLFAAAGETCVEMGTGAAVSPLAGCAAVIEIPAPARGRYPKFACLRSRRWNQTMLKDPMRETENGRIRARVPEHVLVAGPSLRLRRLLDLLDFQNRRRAVSPDHAASASGTLRAPAVIWVAAGRYEATVVPSGRRVWSVRERRFRLLAMLVASCLLPGQAVVAAAAAGEGQCPMHGSARQCRTACPRNASAAPPLEAAGSGASCHTQEASSQSMPHRTAQGRCSCGSALLQLSPESPYMLPLPAALANPAAPNFGLGPAGGPLAVAAHSPPVPPPQPLSAS